MDSQFDSILLSARGKSDREMETAVFAVFFNLPGVSTEFRG